MTLTCKSAGQKGLLATGLLTLAAASTSNAATKPENPATPSKIDEISRVLYSYGIGFEKGDTVPQDTARAESLLKVAAEIGDVRAMGRYGLILFRRDKAAGFPWLLKAARQGDMQAAIVTGIALFNGDGVRADPVEGYAWLKLAVDYGQAAAKGSFERARTSLSVDETARGNARATEMKTSLSAQVARWMAASKTPAAQGPVRSIWGNVPVQATVGGGGATPGWSGSYVIQLGAFSSVENAHDAWSQLRKKYPALESRTARFERAGKLTRLAIAFGQQSQADSACRAIVARGGACFVRKAG